MRIAQLTLNNIGIFQGIHHFDFDPTLNVVYGQNFSGKSTLAGALYYVLCGKVLIPGMKSKDIASESANTGTVGIIYSTHDNMFQIYRSSKGDVQTKRLNGQTWQVTNRSALPALNPQQWSVGCFLREEELGEYLKQTPANRRDLLHQLLGVENLINAREIFINIRRLAKQTEKTAIAKQRILQQSSGTSDYIVELQQQISTVAVLEEKVKMLDASDENKSLRVELDQMMKTITARHEMLENQIITNLCGFKNSEEIDETLKELANRISQQRQYIGEMEIYKEDRISKTSQLRQIEDVISTLNALRDKDYCPTCQQPLSSEQIQQLINDYQEQCRKFKIEIQTIEVQENELIETIHLFDDLAKKESDLRICAERLNIFNKELVEIEQQIKNLSEKMDIIRLPLRSEEADMLQQSLYQQREVLKHLETQHALFKQNQIEVQSANCKVNITSHNRLLSELITDAIDLTLKSLIGPSLHSVEKVINNCLDQFALFQGIETSIDLEKTQLIPDIGNRSFHSLSGSEKSLLYLTLKIGISRLLPECDILVLDNPNLYLDEFRRERLCNYILSLVPEKQIILFTNDFNFANLITKGKRINL
ncbi:MAG: AAA family ATPase [Deltaproteobacteria bacterium]|nr:AAA family ATPase [Deltaproteobacteria bacterium]